ncbi:MAG: PRC-barrel domain-containing protein [Rhodoplanes sp.]
MLKLHLTTCLLATALVGAPALAQTPPQPSSPGSAQQPSAQQQQPSAQQPNAQRQNAQQALKPLAKPGPNHMLSSDLEDTTVYGANNETIGEISDVLIDRNGKVVAVIVGVGGFLGIGEKDVAVPFEAIEIVAAQPSGAGTTGTGPTGTPGTDATSNRAQGTMSPDRIVLRGMTKSDLESAPGFQSDDDDDSNAAGSPARPGGMQQNR